MTLKFLVKSEMFARAKKLLGDQPSKRQATRDCIVLPRSKNPPLGSPFVFMNYCGGKFQLWQHIPCFFTPHNDRARRRHNDHGEYCSTEYPSTSEYFAIITEYRGFEHEVDIAQPLPSYYSNDESSN